MAKRKSVNLDTTIASLKPLIRKAQRRRNAIVKSGLRSQALDLAISAMRENQFYTPKKDTPLPQLVRYKLILQRFLESDTSTIGGIKKLTKKQKEGFKRFLTQQKGFQGDVDLLYRQLQGLDLHSLIESSGLSCDMFFNDLVIAAEDGVLNNFIDDVMGNKRYNPPADMVDINNATPLSFTDNYSAYYDKVVSRELLNTMLKILK